MTNDSLDLAFGALADSTRRAIVRRLSTGTARVTDLAKPFSMSFNAVSKHVKVLESAGLVQRVKSGREHRLSLNPRPLREVNRWVAHYQRFWSDRLESLEQFLKSNPNQEE
jgi:DNA-binding transcriptional ArsR family regulator